MSAAEDFEDTELRDQFGNPPLSKIGAKDSGPITATVDQSIRKNDALPWVVLVAIVACSMGGIAVGLAIGAKSEAAKAERETRLMRLEIDEMKVALKTQGIETHEGSTP